MQNQIIRELASLETIHEARLLEGDGETDHAPYDRLMLEEIRSARILVKDHWSSSIVPGLIHLFDGVGENLKGAWPLKAESLRLVAEGLRAAQTA